MKTHTSGFKEQIKLIGKEIESKITFGNMVLGKNDLNAITPSYQGALLKSVMKQLDIDSNVEIPVGTILKYEFGLKVNGEYEYINFGNYVVYSVEKQEDTMSYKITCYDKLLYSMVDYENMNIQYPISIRGYINKVCEHLGLVFANVNDEFANYDKLIHSELYLDGEKNHLGYTFRDVFDELAQVTASVICLNENDELEIRYINNTEDIIDEEYLKNVNVNFGKKFGAINTIVLSRSANSDSVYYPSEIPENPIEFKISDNQIMNFNDRSDYLPDIYEKLNGLEFYINDFSSTGVVYYDLYDMYNVKIGDNIYPCLMLNDEVLITQGLEEIIYTDKPEETNTDYNKADKTDRKINQVSLIVDKQNQTIQSIASRVAEISKTITGNGTITLENAHEGNLHKLTIKGNISLLYPNYNLFPSLELYPRNFTLKIDETLYELDLNYLNYINSRVCDEFVYQDNKTYIIRRVGINENGELYELDNEIIETKKDLTLNVLENSTISLLGFENAILSAEYLLQNKYSEIFATEAYVNSEIKQTADEINIEVAKKVNENEVVNQINVSTEQILLKGNRVVIESDNFDLDANGKITATAGEIGGFELQKNSLKIIHLPEESDFTQDDLLIVRNHVQNGTSLSQEQIIKYDFNGDGKVTPIDLLKLQNIVLVKNQNVNIEINSDDFENFINVESDNFGTSFNVSLSGTTINSLITEDITIKDKNGNTSLNIFEDGTILADMTNSEGGVWTIQNFGSQVFTVNKNGQVQCVSLTQTSQEKYKKNFEKLENALEIIKDTNIYKYNLKTQDDTEKKHIGFVIGDNYKYREEITSEKNDGVDIYSMVSVCFKAIQEQQEQIENLKEEIKKLKEMIK